MITHISIRFIISSILAICLSGLLAQEITLDPKDNVARLYISGAKDSVDSHAIVNLNRGTSSSLGQINFLIDQPATFISNRWVLGISNTATPHTSDFNLEHKYQRIFPLPSIESTTKVLSISGAASNYRGNMGIGTDWEHGTRVSIKDNGVENTRGLSIELNTDGDKNTSNIAFQSRVTGGSPERNYGIFSVASNTDGQSYGVYGSGSTTGLYGVSSNIGVLGSGQVYDFYATGAGVNYGSPSSKRWKHEIENIDHPLEKIQQLRGVYFKWDESHGGKKDVGFIAEEVGEVLPEIVLYEADGINAKGLDYSKITPLLVQALKELIVKYEIILERLDEVMIQIEH